jgi:hypothetical protein
MAIKGKKRARSRPRTVAAAPRPFLVPPKTPLFRRKGFQLVLILLLLGIVSAFAFGYRISRDTAAHTEAVEEFGGQVDTYLQGRGVGQPIPGAVLILPQMGQALAELSQGQANPQKLAKDAASWEKAAAETANLISSLEVEVAPLKDARLTMAQGLRIYASVAANLQVATGLEGRAQRQMLDNLGTELQTAADIFDTGYQLLQEERRKADLLEAATPGGLPGVPGLPGGVPGVPGGIPGLPGEIPTGG